MDQLSRIISQIIYEMRDNRNDGWTKEHYRARLEKIKKDIEKALSDES